MPQKILENFILKYIEYSILTHTEYRILKTMDTFHATSLFLYPLKTSESLWFSDFLWGIENDQWHDTG